MYRPTGQVATPKRSTIVQRSFPKGTVTVLSADRTPNTAVVDMTNMDIVQDSLAKPRPSTVAYGPTALGTIIGIGTFTKLNSGVPQKWQITMQVVGGVGKVVINKDGGAWTTIGGSYSATAWCQFTQSTNRVYISNGTNVMSYYDINLGTIVSYTALTTPATPTLVASASLTSGTTSQTYYYAISALNNVGETIGVISAALSINKLRDAFVSGTDSITVTGTAVTNAVGYNIYLGRSTDLTSFSYLTTVTPAAGVAPVWADNGSTIANIFKTPGVADGTGGAKLTFLISANGQLFGVGDPVSPYKMWYSGKNEQGGNFAPGFGNAGGYAYINYGGDSLPTVVQSFRDGKGNPVITVLTHGQAGAGKFYHASETSTVYGTQTITYFQVYEANGQSGTISPFGVVQANNNIYYPTGDNFKSTGTQPNIINILATNSISQAIDPSVRGLNLSAMSKCCGLFWRDRIFWAVANGTTSNNEIWIHDIARGGLWILRWTLAATWLWLYEDNSGVTHMCALVGNTIVEFSTTVLTQDQGVPFKTRLASGSIVWDESGVSLAAVQSQRFKLMYPQGSIQINDYGLGEDLTGIQTLGGTTYTATVSRTGWGQWTYGRHTFGEGVGVISYYSQSVGIVVLEPDETLNQISWEIITTGANCDYVLSTVTTVASVIPGALLGD